MIVGYVGKHRYMLGYIIPIEVYSVNYIRTLGGNARELVLLVKEGFFL